MRTFFFSYVGGKSKDFKYLKPYINLDGINTVVEPFCGSCSFSYCLNKDIKYHFNDSDNNLIDFLKDVKNNKFSDCIDYFNKNYEKYIKDNKPTTLWRDLLNMHDIDTKNYFLRERLRSRKSLISLRNKKENLSDYMDLVKFFSKAEYSNKDYKITVNEYIDDENAFLFFDPPYLNSYNSSYKDYKGKITDENNNIRDNTSFFIDIINILLTAKCKIMFIVNSNSITRYLYKDFIKGTYNKRYDMTGRKIDHLIITNYSI